MKLAKKVFSLIFILLATFSFAQELDPPETYEELLNEYEILFEDYETLLNEYDSLISEYDATLSDFEDLRRRHEINLNYNEELLILYELQGERVEQYSLALTSANADIDILQSRIRTLMRISNTSTIGIIPQIGYEGENPTFGIGGRFKIPFLPLSIFIDSDLRFETALHLNLQIGIEIGL